MNSLFAELHLPEPILVVGGYGYRNVGDEAILSGLLSALGDAHRVTVVSRLPAETQAMHGVPAVGPAGAPQALRHHRSVVIGGGGLFGGGMGVLGRSIAAFGLFASWSGRAVAITGVGVDGPLPWMSALPLRRLAPRLEALTVRDHASADVLADVGIAARVDDDLSTVMRSAPASAGNALLRAVGLDPRRSIVGLALTGLADGPDPAGELVLVDIVRSLAAALPDVQLCAVPMSQHPFVATHNDLLLARRIRAAVPRLAVLESVHHPALVLAAVGRFSAMVAMRYHAMLFADRMGVPLVPLPYAPKCRAWLTEHGMAPVSATGSAVSAAVGEAIARSSAPQLANSA